MKLLVTLLFSAVLFAVQPLAAQTDTITPEAQISERTGRLVPVVRDKSRRKAAPDFTLPDASGKPLTLSAYKGKVVLLDFWATWCHGCKTEIPWYVEFYKAYRSQGLAVIGVSMDDGGMKVVKPFLAEKGIEYPVVIGSEALANRYGLTAMPLTLLIDREGRIAVSHAGVVDKQDFESHIRELLK